MGWKFKHLLYILLTFNSTQSIFAQRHWTFGINGAPAFSHIRILANYNRYDYSYKSGKLCYNGSFYVKRKYHDAALSAGIGFSTNGSQGFESFAYLYPPKKERYTKLTHFYLNIPLSIEYPLNKVVRFNMGISQLIPVATKKSTTYFENDIQTSVVCTNQPFVLHRKYNLTLNTGLKIYLPKTKKTLLYLYPDINFTLLNYKANEEIEIRFTVFGLGIGIELNR